MHPDPREPSAQISHMHSFFVALKASKVNVAGLTATGLTAMHRRREVEGQKPCLSAEIEASNSAFRRFSKRWRENS